MWPWWVKIPTKDFTDATLAIDDMEMMLEVAMGVMDMENDKVAVIVLGISNEDFIYGTVVIDGIISKLRCWCCDVSPVAMFICESWIS